MQILVMFYVNTQYEMPHFTCFRDMIWAQKLTNGSHDLDHAHIGVVCYPKANT